MKRCFQNVAKLVRIRRMNHVKKYSQADLSKMLGYKNGQFISNVERGLCNVPIKMLFKISDILEIPYDELKSTILKDYSETLDIFYRDAVEKEDKKTSAVSSTSQTPTTL